MEMERVVWESKRRSDTRSIKVICAKYPNSSLTEKRRIPGFIYGFEEFLKDTKHTKNIFFKHNNDNNIQDLSNMT
jgi:hypothetical protein